LRHSSLATARFARGGDGFSCRVSRADGGDNERYKAEARLCGDAAAAAATAPRFQSDEEDASTRLAPAKRHEVVRYERGKPRAVNIDLSRIRTHTSTSLPSARAGGIPTRIPAGCVLQRSLLQSGRLQVC